ncbi:MAG: hypothetical protein HQK51_12625 [Oligoflexia bacterium]|nr:hypothetical protein [Oligoflexia bacterium]
MYNNILIKNRFHFYVFIVLFVVVILTNNNNNNKAFASNDNKADKTTAPTTERAIEKVVEKVVEKAVDKAVDKASEKIVEEKSAIGKAKTVEVAVVQNREQAGVSVVPPLALPPSAPDPSLPTATTTAATATSTTTKNIGKVERDTQTDLVTTSDIGVHAIASVIDESLHKRVKEDEGEDKDKAEDEDKQITEKVAKLKKDMARYERITKELKEEFVGYGKLIDELMAIAELIEQRPKMVQKPIVVPMISFPGYGKTTIIQTFLKKMGWDQSKYRQFALEKNATTLPTKEMLSFGEETDNSSVGGVQGIILYDEVGNLKKQKAVEKEEEDRLALQRKIEESSATTSAAKSSESEKSKSGSGSSEGGEGDSENENNIMQIIKGGFVSKKNLSSKQARDKDLKTTLWSILGNGTHAEQPENTPDDYIRFFTNLIGKADEIYQKRVAIESYKEELKSKKEEIRKIEQDALKSKPINQERMNMLKSEVSELESSWKSPLAEAKKELEKQNKIINAIRMAFMQIQEDYPQLLGKEYDGMKVTELETLFYKDPAVFVKAFKKNKDLVKLDRKKYFRRMIFFLTGNPEELIAKVRSEFEHMPENEINPDQLREKSQAIITQDALKIWFRDIFAEDPKKGDPGLESRLNLASWKIMLPFGSTEWRALTKNVLEKYKKQFKEALAEYGLKDVPEITIDISAEDLLYYEGINPLEGPRSLMDTANKMYGSFIVNLISKLVADKDLYSEAQKKGIKVFFDPISLKLMAKLANQKVDDSNKPIFVTSIELNKRAGIVNSNDDSLYKRQAIHQVGYGLTGMLILKSVPNYLELLKPYESENDLKKLWDTYQVETYKQKKAMLYTMLGAIAAELEYLPNTMVSTKIKSGAYREKALAMAKSIKESLDTIRKTKYPFGYHKQKKIPLNLILTNDVARDKDTFKAEDSFFSRENPFISSNDTFLSLIDLADESLKEEERNQKLDTAIAYALEEVQKLIKNNSRTVSALANELLKSENKSITGEKIRQIMDMNYNKKVRYPKKSLKEWFVSLFNSDKKSVKDLILAHEPGATDLCPCPILDTPYRTEPKAEIFGCF